MSKRHAIPSGKSHRMFSKTAGNQKVHPKNITMGAAPGVPSQRGGGRL